MENLFQYRESEQYINLLQENITRMANNSANCKNWLVAIIAGSLAISFSNDSTNLVSQVLYFLKWITGLFFFLDCLYLGIERDFIKMEKVFVNLCKSQKSNIEDVKKMLMSFSATINIEEKVTDGCQIKLRKLMKQLKGALCAMFSWSTTPFYGIIFYVLYKISNLS